MQIGLEKCLEQTTPILKGKRFGLVMNQASIDRRFRYAHDCLSEAYPDQLVAIFSPQHGLWGEQQANMIESPHGSHRLGIPVHSLYSETRKPTQQMLANLDCLVIDLQDVGTRVYTFIWTMVHCLEAAAENNLEVVVLDRPNPLGGERVEGPQLKRDFRSFVGLFEIPMRHGLTIGELARLANEYLEIGADLNVIEMSGWRRNVRFEATELPWVPPSPNMPTLQTAAVYPGQVLLEGTNLSEGRGTTTPFEIVGAPFIDPDTLASRLQEFELLGVQFRPLRFCPTFDKWAGESCGGVQIHVTDLDRFDSYRSTLAILAVVTQLWPSVFSWLPPPYEYETIKPPIDILTGDDQVRLVADTGKLSMQIDELAGTDQTAWHEMSAKFHLYE